MVAANSYQLFTWQVWDAIIERTASVEAQRMHKATQVTRMHDVVAFLTEANLARNQHLLEFQGNVEKWAADHPRKVEMLEQQRTEDRVRMVGLEQQLAQAQSELQRMATAVPLPKTPAMLINPSSNHSPEPTWSLGDHGAARGTATHLVLGSPLNIGPRRQRPPAIPLTPPGWATVPPLQGPLASGGAGEGPPPTYRPPRRSPTTPSSPRTPSRLFRLPSPLTPRGPSPPGPTPQELTQVVANEVAHGVAEGLAHVQASSGPRGEAI